ncbi:MAG: hypothetical protein WAU81_12965 [Candidatus Aminicenantales bacterium]
MTRKIFNAALALFFIAVIFLPLLSKIIPIEPRIRLQEQRMLADRTKLKWTLAGLLRYPDTFNSYYKDNFGLRSGLVHLFGRIRSQIPGLIVGNKVLVGRDDWYFITQNRTLDDFLGIIRLSASELNEIKDVLEERKGWLAMFGIKYLLTVAPAKWEIYPEKVPVNLNRVSARTVLDQIAAFLKDNGGIDLLDLRKPLRELKNSYRVYSRADTHWNSVGLFAAVQEIKKRLADWFPGISADSLESYDIKEDVEYSGDLARMMGLGGTIPQKKYTLIGKDGEMFPPRVPALENSLGQILAFEGPAHGPRKAKAVIFHDSFGIAFPLYLRDSFLRSVYSWRSFPDTRLIIREHPDVVIQELAQRSIMETLSKNPPGMAGPNSILTGKAAQFHCPDTFRLAGFKAQALCDLPVRQYISLFCNGKKIFEWPLDEEETGFAVPKHCSPPDQNLLVYSFAYRYEPFLPSNADGSHALPFDLRVECGGRRTFIGINGSKFTWSRGYNIYFISLDGRISQAQNFDYIGPGRQGPEMARFIQRVRNKKGFLILIDQRHSGRALTREAQGALHSLGLRGYARDRRQWNHIALVDLGSKRVIAEQSGPAPQRLMVGNYRTDAGFRVGSLRVTKDTD